MINFVGKIKTKAWQIGINFLGKSSFHYFLYRSYWNAKLNNHSKFGVNENYFTAIPNSGAGIGHQMANWNSGYWFSKKFGLQFAHISFSDKNWDKFLGFGENEISVQSLVEEQGYKRVRLPLFREHENQEIILIKRIVDSYAKKNVVFVAEQDQFYEDQFGNIEDLKRKFYNAKVREKDELIFDKNTYNVAIHVRRGDIVIGQENRSPNLTMRWLANEYFETVLRKVLPMLKTDKKISIYLFSQGVESDFESFKEFPSLNFCLDMNAQDCFLHMVYADVLITSKSSFSYKPALLNKGIKVCPENFWHNYPKTKDWILFKDNGDIA